MTFLFICAILIAKLLETNVFPAPGLEEVNITTCRFSDFTRIKSIFVRIMRKASDTESRPFSRTTIWRRSSPFWGLSRSSGISPNNGILNANSRSLRLCTFVSRILKIPNKPAGSAAPRIIEAKRIIILRGATGLLLPDAGSMMRALLSVIACVKAFSSRLFNK